MTDDLDRRIDLALNALGGEDTDFVVHRDTVKCMVSECAWGFTMNTIELWEVVTDCREHWDKRHAVLTELGVCGMTVSDELIGQIADALRDQGVIRIDPSFVRRILETAQQLTPSPVIKLRREATPEELEELAARWKYIWEGREHEPLRILPPDPPLPEVWVVRDKTRPEPGITAVYPGRDAARRFIGTLARRETDLFIERWDVS